MERDSIKTTVLDRDLDVFLKPFKIDGTDLEFGHVLVKKMDKSRPRKADGPKGQDWSHANHPVTTYQATPNDVDGVYTLFPKKNLVHEGWMAWLQAIKQTAAPELNIPDFIKLIDAPSFGHQTKDVAMLVHGVPGLRPDLGILQNPVASADASYRVRSNTKDSQAPVVHVNTAGSPLEVQNTIGALTTVAYNHRGAAFQWIIVPPSSKDTLEQMVSSLFGQEIGETACSWFVKHLSLWITPDCLRSWEIKFFEVKQHAGQLLFLFPNTYHWGFSTGHNVIELRNHAGKDWKCDRWNFCRLANSLCHRANRGQPGLFLGPLDDNHQQAGNEGGLMIDPTPRRTRKRKAVPHETVMDMGSSSPGSGPANPGAQGTSDQAGAGGEYLVDESADPVGHGNIFDAPDFAPGLGGRYSPNSNNEDEHLPYRAEHAAHTYGYEHQNADDVQQQQQFQYLLQENHDLAQERDAARRECDELRVTNEILTSNTQHGSSAREMVLQGELQRSRQQADDLYAMILSRDSIIDELNVQRVGDGQASLRRRIGLLEGLLREHGIDFSGL